MSKFYLNFVHHEIVSALLLENRSRYVHQNLPTVDDVQSAKPQQSCIHTFFNSFLALSVPKLRWFCILKTSTRFLHETSCEYQL